MWGLSALLSGCATPEYRIKKNADLFATFPPEVQENVRRGLIEPGYTRDMVYIAKGEPDRKYQRRTAEGQTEIWSYVGTDTWSDRERVRANYRVRGRDGRTRTVSDHVWVDVDHEREYERFRVEFEGDIVNAFEALMR
jgi:hypothetical protein